MKLFKKVRKLILPLAFVGVGVFGFFQAHASAIPDVDCFDYADVVVHWYGADITTEEGHSIWQAAYHRCEGNI